MIAPTAADYIEVRLRDPRVRLRDRDPARLPLETNFPWLLRCRDLDERLFRAMISSGVWVVVLYAGGTSSSNELPNKGNESDHEQEMDQPTADVEDNEAK